MGLYEHHQKSWARVQAYNTGKDGTSYASTGRF